MINIFLNIEGKKLSVGRLLRKDQHNYFQYTPEFISTGVQISPFHLPVNNQVNKAPDAPFSGLHGVFDDSLPDGWGLLLMDRFLRQKGINVRDITPMDRLLYIGSTGMGALTYEPDHSEPSSYDSLSLSELSHEAAEVFAGKQEDILPELLRAGGSPGGARPKVVVGINGDQIVSGERELPDGYQAWLIKFHATNDNEGLIEELYARMLRLANINMPETQLLMANGKQYFAVKRFDRINNQRLHVHSLAGLSHANFRMPDFDYEKLLRLTSILTRNQDDAKQVYRQMVFNILGNNQDDHTKNFSFVMDGKGVWRLSPAYDITFTQCHGGEQSMSVAGYGKNIPASVFVKLGVLCGIDASGVRQIFAETFEALSQWRALAHELGVDAQQRNEIQQNLDALAKQYRFMGS
ncbi:type II toxin-antitoxin system HipA family toxin [Methylobacter svalbardensis]|uniref:type II toxin-antitoxin system HipA family toxin n=1 Tax=Methylobacter svalbardensis TaxID=3080016 RepID=UPI0030EBCA18